MGPPANLEGVALVTPGPYQVGSGNRSTDYTVTGPGMKLQICSEGGRDMEVVADWVAEHMNVAFKAGKAAATQ